MFGNNPSGLARIGELFGWRNRAGPNAPEPRPKAASSTSTNRVICFRMDDDLYRRITRALRGTSCTRSDFIRNAIERVLKQDNEERLRAAHSAIRWD
jgi:predicted DNA-binding protein